MKIQEQKCCECTEEQDTSMSCGAFELKHSFEVKQRICVCKQGLSEFGGRILMDSSKLCERES